MYLYSWILSFIIILFSTFLSVLTTGKIRNYSNKFLIKKRKQEIGRNQKKFISRMGGVGIYIIFLITFFLLRFLVGFEKEIFLIDEIPYIAILLASSCIFLIGIIDDIIYLSPKIRLLCQFIISIIAWFNGLRIGNIDISFLGNLNLEITLPFFLNLIISSIFLVGMTNALNWIDGLDGLAAGHIGISAFGICLIYIFSLSPLFNFLLPLSLIGSILGFLFYNFYPAKIYMGDGGSNFLGFMISSIAILMTQSSSLKVNIFSLALLNFLPISNMIVVIFERIYNGFSPFYPDRRHIHDKIINMGLSHKNTVKTLYLFSGLFVFLGLMI
tara:strand:+ start:769 stop:1752 length:984 start_codon:yes stop_codon:yes gene_type:complete